MKKPKTEIERLTETIVMQSIAFSELKSELIKIDTDRTNYWNWYQQEKEKVEALMESNNNLVDRVAELESEVEKLTPTKNQKQNEK